MPRSGESSCWHALVALQAHLPLALTFHCEAWYSNSPLLAGHFVVPLTPLGALQMNE